MGGGGEGGSRSTELIARVRASVRYGVSAVVELVDLLLDELVSSMHQLRVLRQFPSLGSCTKWLRGSEVREMKETDKSSSAVLIGMQL